MDYVVGAAIALLGSVVVQAAVVPRVQRAARALDRWEQDVLLLGELISNDLSTSFHNVRRSWWRWRISRRSRLLSEPLFPGGAVISEAEDDRCAASFLHEWQDYERFVRVRLNWLASRIYDRDHTFQEYLRLRFLSLKLGSLPGQLLFNEWDLESLDEIDAWWKREADDQEALLNTVEKLAESIAAPSPVGPVRRRVLRWRQSRRHKNNGS